jgi:hypothetical protein
MGHLTLAAFVFFAADGCMPNNVPEQPNDDLSEVSNQQSENPSAPGSPAPTGTQTPINDAPAPTGPTSTTGPSGPTVDPSTLVTVGAGGDRRYATTDGNVSITGDTQDLAPSNTDWSDGHTDTMIRGLCFGAGRFLAVGGQGDGTFRSSTDGATWTTLVTLDGNQGRPKASWLGGCAYGENRFVAAGGNGARCHSTDGLTWLCPGGYQAFHHRAVAYGGGRFVTVGNSYDTPPDNFTSVSADGTTWTNLPTLGNVSSNRILYVAEHARFYAVFGAVLGQLADGQTSWTAVAGVDASGVSGMTVKDGVVYIIGTRPTQPYDRFLYTSNNGTNWTVQTPTSAVDSMHYDPRSAKFLGHRINYSNPIVPVRKSSSDGVTWTEVTETSAFHAVGLFATGVPAN